MKYTFKCPHYGSTNLVEEHLICRDRNVDIITDTPSGMAVDEYGRAETFYDTERVTGFRCGICGYRWFGLEEIQEDNGLIEET